MPIYEYTCSAGHEFEELVSRRDAATTSCPACGAEAGRVMSAPSPTPGDARSAAAERSERLAGGGLCGAEACTAGGCQGLKN